MGSWRQLSCLQLGQLVQHRFGPQPWNPRAGASGWRGVGLQQAWALDSPAQGLLPGFLWADQIPAAGDRLGQGKQHQLPNGLAGLALPGAAGAEQGGGGLHRRKEKKRPPLAPTKPPGQGRQQGARLGLDPAALPARQVAGAWANHWGKCSPLRRTTADPEPQQTNRVKKPGLGPRPGLSLWLLSLWLLGLRQERAAWLRARSAAPATHAGPAAADRAHQRGPDTRGWRAGPPLPGG